MAARVMDGLLPHTGNSVRLGITGVPGVGKSTFVENLGLYHANKGHRVAVLAVDPSSQRSGGSILGGGIKPVWNSLPAMKIPLSDPLPQVKPWGGAAKTREMIGRSFI